MEKTIKDLIEKYEDKIRSAESLKRKGTGAWSDAPDGHTIERLNVRIYERKTFIEDLKNLLNHLT